MRTPQVMSNFPTFQSSQLPGSQSWGGKWMDGGAGIRAGSGPVAWYNDEFQTTIVGSPLTQFQAAAFDVTFVVVFWSHSVAPRSPVPWCI